MSAAEFGRESWMGGAEREVAVEGREMVEAQEDATAGGRNIVCHTIPSAQSLRVEGEWGGGGVGRSGAGRRIGRGGGGGVVACRRGTLVEMQ